MAIPARSAEFGGATRNREIGCVLVSAPLAMTVALPLPILHPLSGRPLAGGAVLMHVPPLIDASDSSPGGRISVRSLTVSAVVSGLNLISVLRAADEPAWLPPWVSVSA